MNPIKTNLSDLPILIWNENPKEAYEIERTEKYVIFAVLLKDRWHIRTLVKKLHALRNIRSFQSYYASWVSLNEAISVYNQERDAYLRELNAIA